MEEKKRILVADNSEFYTQEFARILRQDGFDVVTATGGEEAVREASRAIRLDLLIVDLEMPGMLGFEVIKEIRRNRKDPALPVLALSGSFERANVEGMLKNLTVVRFLKKTTRSEEILFWVRAILFPREKFSRKSPRIIVDLPVTFTLGADEYSGRTFTLSEDGIFIRTHFVANLESNVRLKFAVPPDDEVETEGVVVWINDFNPGKNENVPFGMGFRFLELQDGHRQTIKRYVLDKIIG